LCGGRRQEDFIETCERCHGKCCYEARPPLTRNRIKLILRHLDERNSDAGFSVHAGRYSHPEELGDGYCVLFDRASGLCRVHPTKPETCAAGPVTFDIDWRRGVIEWYLKQEKICPLAGTMARDNVALTRHLESAKQEILRLVDELEISELLAVLEVEEDDTFKIGEDHLPQRILEKQMSSAIREDTPARTLHSHTNPLGP
jgi:Fe-S-cluster containining protein